MRVTTCVSSSESTRWPDSHHVRNDGARNYVAGGISDAYNALTSW